MTVEEAIQKIQARLAEIGPNAFWLNGYIRNSRLHQTKGWRGERVEAMPLGRLRGFIDKDTQI